MVWVLVSHKQALFLDLTLAQARDKIPQLRELLKNGKDPIVVMKRIAAPTGATLDDCVH